MTGATERELVLRYLDLFEDQGSVTPQDLGTDHETHAHVVKVVQSMQEIRDDFAPVAASNKRGQVPLPGLLARYQPEQWLNAGGYGDIFRANDHELQRAVAVKVARRAGDSSSRLQLEAELIAGLEHPGIVPIYGFGLVPQTNQPYYAMRLIAGKTLAEATTSAHTQLQASRSTQDLVQALRPLIRRFVSVCQTVAYAHSKGVIHRDITPKNIMLGDYGETLLLDWGLARRQGDVVERSSDGGVPDSDNGLTLSGDILGTPSYIAPELLANGAKTVSPSADIYSLGSTLLYLLTNTSPGKHVTWPVPPALMAIVATARQMEPGNRYASATDLADDLERWLNDEPVSVYREPVSQRLARWSRKRRVLIAALSTAVPLLVGLTVMLWLWRGADQAKRQAIFDGEQEATRISTTAREEARSQVLEGYPVRLSEAELLRRDGNTEAGLQALQSSRAQMESFGEAVGFEWGYRHWRLNRDQSWQPFDFNHVDKVVGMHQVDPAGPVMTVSEDGFVATWDSKTRKLLQSGSLEVFPWVGSTGLILAPTPEGDWIIQSLVPDSPAANFQPTIVPGTKLLAIGDGLVPTRGKSLNDIINVLSGEATKFVTIKLQAPDGTERVISLGRKIIPYATPFPSGNKTLPAVFSRSGRYVAVNYQLPNKSGFGLTVCDITTGRAMMRLSNKTATMPMAMALSPEGDRLVVNFAGKDYICYDTATGKKLGTYRNETPAPMASSNIAFDPTGEYLWSTHCTMKSHLGRWKRDQFDTGPTPFGLNGQPEVSDEIRWNRAGNLALIASRGAGTPRLFDKRTQRVKLVEGTRGAISSMAWDASGRYFALADATYTVLVFDADGNKLSSRVLPEAIPASALQLLPGGTLMVAQRKMLYTWDWTIDAVGITGTGLSARDGLTAMLELPDGDFLAAVWNDVSNAASLRRFHGKDGVLRSVVVQSPSERDNPFEGGIASLSPDGTLLAVANTKPFVPSPERQVSLFNWPAMTLVKRAPVPQEYSQIGRVDWSADGKRVYFSQSTASDEAAPDRPSLFERNQSANALAWTISDDAPQPLILTEGSVQAIVCTEDGKYLLAAGEHDLFIRDAKTHRLIHRVLLPHSPIQNLSASKDGRWAVVAAGQLLTGIINEETRNRLYLVDISTGTITKPPLDIANGSVGALAYSPDGNRVVVALTNGTLLLVDPTTWTMKSHDICNQMLSGVQWEPDGQNLVISSMQMLNPSAQGAIWRFDVKQGKAAKLPVPVKLPFLWPKLGALGRAAVTDCGSNEIMDVLLGSDTPTVVRHALPGDKNKAELLNGKVLAMCRSADRQHVLLALENGQVEERNGTTGVRTKVWKAQSKDTFLPQAIAERVDGIVVVGIVADETEVVRADLLQRDGTRKTLLTTESVGFFGNTRGVNFRGVSLDPDGTRLAVALDRLDVGEPERLALYDLTDGSKLAEWKAEHDGTSLPFIQQVHWNSATKTVGVVGSGYANDKAPTQAKLLLFRVGDPQPQAVLLHPGAQGFKPTGQSAATMYSGLTCTTDGETWALQRGYDLNISLVSRRLQRVTLDIPPVGRSVLHNNTLHFDKTGRTLLEMSDGLRLYPASGFDNGNPK